MAAPSKAAIADYKRAIESPGAVHKYAGGHQNRKITCHLVSSKTSVFYSYGTVIGYCRDSQVFLTQRKYSQATSRTVREIELAAESLGVPVNFMPEVHV